MNYVFLAIDTTDGAIKKHIIDHLIESKIPFIDTGIGLLTVDDMILGQVRITACTPDKNDHINSRIPLSSGAEEDVYATNIQIAELNALSAVLAVIKWKKFMGFYQDLTFEFNTTYSINNGILVND